MQCPDDAAPQVGVDRSCTSNAAQQRFCCCYFPIDPEYINYYHLGSQSLDTAAVLHISAFKYSFPCMILKHI